MQITRASEYAIRAILYMAHQPYREVVLKKDICKSQDVTPAFLTKIFQPLIKCGIIGSQRGVGGGFYLARKPEEITLLDVIRAQEGEILLNTCLESPGTCERDTICPVHGTWAELRQTLLKSLADKTFADLLQNELEILGKRSA